MSFAIVSIVGNLTRPPEQTSFSSGKTRTTFVVAVNVRAKTEKPSDSADFYRVEAWGRLGELAMSYLSKGNQVTVSGRLLMDKWTDKEGRERITPTIKAENLAFPGRVRSSDEDGASRMEHEFADDSADNQRTVANIKTAANVMMSPSSVMTTSRSADPAKAAPTATSLAASGRRTQTA